MTSLADKPSLNILLAEDNLVNQQVALLMLQQMGYSATVANNGLEVLEALGQRFYDVILMDVQMPEMDGLTAAQQIRQKWEDDCRPMIIAMTASLQQSDYDLCLAAGIDGYISKPIQFEELEMALEQCYTKKQILAEQPLQSSALASDPLSQAVEPPIDYTILAELRRNLESYVPTALAQLIECYLVESPNQIQSLQQSILDRDAQALRHAAHTLKSSSRALGATTLFHLCSLLEEYGRVGTLELAAEKLDDFKQEFERFKAALEQELG